LGLTLTAIEARHNEGNQSLALRVQLGNRTLAYTGDGEDTEALRALEGVYKNSFRIDVSD
jgi:beta-lactamase superfamily II metal-dependent hydrolase